MESVFSLAPFVDSASIKVNAPISVMWDTMTDIKTYHSFISHVIAVEAPSEDVYKVGTRWRETRVYKGTTYVGSRTVTGLQSEPLQTRICAQIAQGSFIQDISKSSTYTLLPINNESCELVMADAYHPGGIVGRLQTALCRCCMTRHGHRVIQEELSDMAAEAERRYNERQP